MATPATPHLHPPPGGPPAFLGEADLESLAAQGHVPLKLPQYLHGELSAFFAAADTFFRLPTAEKSTLYPSQTDNTEVGYHCVPEEKQYVTFRHASAHTDPPDIEALLSSIWHDIAHLLYRILFDVGRYLGVDNAAWLPLVERSLRLPADRPNITTTLLRIFRYEPNSGVADPHMDLGLLTLCVGSGRGLQVWDSHAAKAVAGAGADCAASSSSTTKYTAPVKPSSLSISPHWRDAAPVTLLVGDTLRVLSSNRFKAGRHQVVTNPDGRDSIVFALRPDVRTVLDLRMYGGEGQVHTKELWDAIRNGRVNVNAQKDVREEQWKQRKEIAERKQADGSGRDTSGVKGDARAEYSGAQA